MKNVRTKNQNSKKLRVLKILYPIFIFSLIIVYFNIIINESFFLFISWKLYRYLKLTHLVASKSWFSFANLYKTNCAYILMPSILKLTLRKRIKKEIKSLKKKHKQVTISFLLFLFLISLVEVNLLLFMNFIAGTLMYPQHWL